MCLAQGHNTVMPARLEPATSWSGVKHSTTEPLGSLIKPVLSGHSKRRTKIGFQDSSLLHAGQKCFGMLQESILQYL